MTNSRLAVELLRHLVLDVTDRFFSCSSDTLRETFGLRALVSREGTAGFFNAAFDVSVPSRLFDLYS